MSITFRVNLEAPNRYSYPSPSSTMAEADNFSNTRSTWFPNNVLFNRQLKHGDTFSVSGLEAIYLRDNFATGDNAFLDVV